MSKTLEGNLIKVKCTGDASIVMDAMRGHISNVPVEEKLYTDDEGYIGFPAQNVKGFLCSQYSSAVKAFTSSKEYKNKCAFVKANTRLVDDGGKAQEFYHILNENNEKIKWDSDNKKQFGIKTGTVKPSPAAPRDVMPSKPIIKTPWKLNFNVFLIKNDQIRPSDMKRYIEYGGRYVGIGSFRPDHGVFSAEFTEE